MLGTRAYSPTLNFAQRRCDRSAACLRLCGHFVRIQPILDYIIRINSLPNGFQMDSASQNLGRCRRVVRLGARLLLVPG